MAASAALEVVMDSSEADAVSVIDLISVSDDGSIVDLTLTPVRPRRAPPRRTTSPKKTKKSKKMSNQSKDWECHNLDAGVRTNRGPAYVYVLESTQGDVYTGSWRDATCKLAMRAAADTIATEHNSGSRRSTKNKAPWAVKCLVGPFITRSAAFKFESLVKSRGSRRGLGPKIKAARRAVVSAHPAVAATYVRVEGF